MCIWFMCEKSVVYAVCIVCLHFALKKVVEEEEENVPISAKRQCVIRDNTAHLEISAPHSK